MVLIKVWMVLSINFLLRSCFGLASEQIYHIMPALTDPCPAKPCLTLFQFANDYSANINTTLVILPGKHSIGSKISVANVGTFLMTSNDSSTEIICHQYGSLTFTNVHFVHIYGLNFTGCAGNRVESVESLIIEDSNFIGEEDSTATDGAALEIYNSSIIISRCSFQSYRGSIQQVHTNRRTNSKVPSTGLQRNGGAIMSVDSSITILASRFERNSADAGGVIATYQGILIVLDKCEFSENKVYNNGGVIHSYQATVTISNGNSFNRNVALNNGGVVYAFESDLNISGVNIFDGNTAYDGGAINTYESKVSILYGNIFINNVAHNDGGAMCAYQSSTRISEGNIFSNNVALNDGGAVHAYQQNFSISDTNFVHNNASNDGGAIWVHKANTKTTKNSYSQNYAGNRGGVWNIYKGFLKILQSNLSHNEASDGGAIFADMGKITLENSSLVENGANKGGALHTYQSDVFIFGTNLSQNSAQEHGGGWYMREGKAMVLDSVFKQNSACDQGGTWHMEDSRISMEELIITRSRASNGAAMYATSCILDASKSLLISHNIAQTMGTVYAVHSSFKLNFDGKMKFSENYGSLVMFNSNATFMGTTYIINCSESVRLHDKLDVRDHEGGAITLFKSLVIFGGSTYLFHNYAEDGGAIHAVNSEVHIYGDTSITSNTANKTGGGVYLFQSVTNFQGNHSVRMLKNEAGEKGGGMHAVNSTLNVEAHFYGRDSTTHSLTGSTLTFIENKATNGGGLYMDVYTKLYVKISPSYNDSNEIIKFRRNLARYGGALYESHSSDTGICLSPKFRFDSKARECAIQTIVVGNTLSDSTNIACSGMTSKSVFFQNNSAMVSGSSLYSELQGRCNFTFYNEHRCISPRRVVMGIDYFRNISNIKNWDIGSKPAQLCFCKEGRKDCSYNPGPIGVSNGAKFSIELVAVDHARHTVNAAVRTTLLRTGGHLGDGQIYQQVIHKNCTKFTYNVFSPNNEEVLNMHIDTTSVKTTLIIQFTACDFCPIGFNKTVDERNVCKCVCDPKLKDYVKSCNATREVITREGEFWITYINTSDVTTSGYLIYPFCPYNYCLPSTSTVEINLNLPKGADSQCADGHSGLLCGQCQRGLSLSVGSSRCIPCSNEWPITLTVMIIAGLLAGVLLVVLLMSINLTVAIGTLNSIIFYANIIQANSSIFLPFSKPNIATLFISSLNLEIGFDTCLFEGMDAYWKTLLHLVIPFYVIFLVVVIIFTTERSTRFAKLLARKNPVATLATLVLLSYSKQLQTVIASLSYARLEYPDGSLQTVWLPDASVEYLKGKHIVLFTIAILILLVGGFYTILLFTWQWLLRHQNKLFLRWMKHQKLCHFIEPYHAPYNFSQRYWFGLLLIARIPVYIISAVTRDPRFKLLSTCTVIMCLLLLRVFSLEKLIYRNRLLDILDTIMHINIIGFAALTWYTFDAHPNQQVCTSIAYISVCVTLTLLMCVVFYHMMRFTRLSSVAYLAKKSITRLLPLKKNANSSAFPDDTSDTTSIVTYSIIELTEYTTEGDAPKHECSGHDDCSVEDAQKHFTSNNCKD